MSFQPGIRATRKPPTIVSRSTTQQTTTTTNHAVSLPAGIVAGELLLIIWGAVGTGGYTQPSGWTIPAANNGGLVVFSKVATGAEGATATITTSSSVRSCAVSMRVANAVSYETVTNATGTSVAPDPPSVSPSWAASKASVNIAAMAVQTSSDVPSAAPAGYGNLTTATVTGMSIGSADKVVSAASENPGTFTIPTSGTWAAANIAIQGL